MKSVLMSVLSISMVVESTHDHGSTGRTAGSGGKCVEKQSAVFGEGIDSRGLGNGIAVATKSGRFIIRDKENDILFVGNDGNRDFKKVIEISKILNEYKFIFVTNQIKKSKNIPPNVPPLDQAHWRVPGHPHPKNIWPLREPAPL